MDLNTLYTLLIVAFVLIVVLVTLYIKRKRLVSPEDLLFAIDALNLTSMIVNDLHLKNEKQIKLITDIIIITLQDVVEFTKSTDKNKVIESAYIYAQTLCLRNGIELTVEKKNIILQLLKIGINNRYADKFIK